jgi:hypothetical protein
MLYRYLPDNVHVVGINSYNDTVNIYNDTVNIYTLYITYTFSSSQRDRDRMVIDLQLPMPSVPITTNDASSNPAQARCTRYNIM